MFDSIVTMPLVMQLALGAGYAGYAIAYAGLRRDHSATDAALCSLAFGVPAILVFSALVERGQMVAALAGFVVAIGVACLWRMGGRDGAYFLLNGLGVHQDDGLSNTWDALIHRKGLKVSQMSVHMTDGRILYLSDRTLVKGAPFDGLLLGGDGSIAMVVQKERAADGSTVEKSDIADDEWGYRLTYIPADHVAQVNIRIA